MKKYISALAISALVLSSCSDFLDVQPEGDPTTNSYFHNDQQAIEAVDALYERFHQEAMYGRELFWEQGATTDVVWGRSRSYPSLANFQYNGNESPLRDVWEASYIVQSRANWVVQELLKKQEQTPLSAVEKRSLGEAYFTRAWAHYLIAYRYGTDKQGVPFVRYEDFENGYNNEIPPQRESVMVNYQLIIDDFDKAFELLPRFEEYDVDNRGRAHKAACVAFKAKVYAYWAAWDKSQWGKVIELVNSLENTYERGLADTYAELFSSDFADYWNREYIWTIPGTGGSTGGGSDFPGVVLENKGWGIYNGWGQNKPAYDLYEEMSKDGKGNDRLVRTILEYNQEFQFWGETRRFSSSSDFESGFQINKYMDPFKHKDADVAGYVNTNGNWPTARVNFPIIRFAEMLLFRAEAYLVTGQAEKATEDINRLRRRSHLSELDGTATMANIYHERRCELAFEFYDHLYDLKRWHMSGDATIKALADDELSKHPRVRIYEDRSNPESKLKGIEPYKDYPSKGTYQDHMIVFPYPPTEIVKSNGQWKQNAGY